MKLFINKKGVTFIELLIAISVFAVGIVTVLSILSSNIMISGQVKYRSKATMLAKEGLEVVYNQRNTNLIKGLKWNNIEYNDSYISTTSFKAGKDYIVSIQTGGTYKITELNDNQNDKKQLYYYTGSIDTDAENDKDIFRYGHTGHNETQGQLTKYQRHIHTTGLNYGGEVLKINSIVKYGPYEKDKVILESFIADR